MIPADNDQGVVQLSHFLKTLQHQSQCGIERLNLTEIIGHILAYFVHVG